MELQCSAKLHSSALLTRADPFKIERVVSKHLLPLQYKILPSALIWTRAARDEQQPVLKFTVQLLKQRRQGSKKLESSLSPTESVARAVTICGYSNGVKTSSSNKRGRRRFRGITSVMLYHLTDVPLSRSPVFLISAAN